MTLTPITDMDLLVEVREMAQQAQLDGNMPRVHPNGFIQLDLQPSEGWDKHDGHSGANRRLHIWNPPGIELPHQETVNEIHDHVFDMQSHVVRGSLVQKRYALIIGGEPKHTERFEVFRAVYDQKSNSRLVSTGIIGELEMISADIVSAGEIYEQPAFTLHDTGTPSGLVVTVMEKVKVHEGGSTVICPVGVEPDNDFDRLAAADQDDLWAAIERSLT